MAASQLATFESAFLLLRDAVKPHHAVEFQSTTLKDVWEAANEIQRVQRQRRSLRNMGRLKPFLQGLEKYSKSIDTLCNGTPFLPWVWAPVKLILQLASEHPVVLDKLLDAYSQIAGALPRFDRFQCAFHYDQNINQALALVYEDILEFHRNTYIFLKRGAWHVLFDSLWKNFGPRFLGILEKLERHRDLVDKEASAIAIIEAKKWRAQQQDNIDRLESERRDRQLQDCISWLAIDDRSQEDALDKLSQRRQAGTCEWVLNNSHLRTWIENQNEEPVLWLKGIPGAGKSVLTCRIIQDLRENPDLSTIFYFCNSHTGEGDLCSRVLRTLILELLRSQPHLTTHIYETYTRQLRTPSLGQIKKLLPDLLSAVSSTRIVIDGLDECKEKDQKAILTELLSAVKSSTAPSKLFISSRAENFISKALRKRPTISLTEKNERKKLDEDIQEYVKYSLKGLRASFPGTLIDDVEKIVVKKAHGMFLWVRLVIVELLDRESAYELLKAVHDLPQGLHKAYHRILDRIKSEYSEYSSQKAVMILQWMACSFRPLKTFEIQDGLVFIMPDSILNDETKPSKSLLDLCKPIIEEGVENTVGFVHFSAKEYILHETSGPFLKECDAHLTVSFACATYLSTSHCLIDSHSSEEDQVLRVAKGFHGLHVYASEFLIKHILRYAELQYRSKSDFSEALAAQLERLLQFEKGYLSIGFNAALDDGKSLPDVVQRFVTLNLPPKLYTFLRNMLVFQDISTQDNHHHKDPLEIQQLEVENDPTTFSAIFYQYHSIIEFLIETPEDSISGIEATIVRDFKNTYGDSALLCRYRPCPRASIGFSRTRDRDKHESSHTRKFKCDDSACEFHDSGFSTKAALQKHKQVYHHKMNDFVLPIRRRPNTTSLRDRFLDRSDSQPNVQTQRQRQAYTTQSQVHRLDYFNSDFGTLQDRTARGTGLDMQTTQRAESISRFEERLPSFDEQQHSSLPGRKYGLSEYKERRMRKSNMRQTPQAQKTPSLLYTQVPPVLPAVASTVPLNAANLQQQQQLHRMHQSLPVSPSSTQPPFLIAASSPQGTPTYIGKPAIAQENLYIPARKKQKQNNTSQNTPSLNASPQLNEVLSPDIQRQPAKLQQMPALCCSEPDCDRHNVGFDSEEALRFHMQEVHTQPTENPAKHTPSLLPSFPGLDSQDRFMTSDPRWVMDGDNNFVRVADVLSSSTPRAAVVQSATRPWNRSDSGYGTLDSRESWSGQNLHLEKDTRSFDGSSGASSTSIERKDKLVVGNFTYVDGASTTKSEHEAPDWSPSIEGAPSLIQPGSDTGRKEQAYGLHDSEQQALTSFDKDQTRHSHQQTSSYWSVPEMNDFPALLQHFGTDWSAIAKHMTSKTHIMVKNFYSRRVESDKMSTWETIARDADEKIARGEWTGPLPTPFTFSKRPFTSMSEHEVSRTRPLTGIAPSEALPLSDSEGMWKTVCFMNSSPVEGQRPEVWVKIGPQTTTKSIMATVETYLQPKRYALPGVKFSYYFEDDQGKNIIPQYESLRHEMVVRVRMVQEELQDTASNKPDSHPSTPSDTQYTLSREQDRVALQIKGELTAVRILGHHRSAPVVKFLMPKAFEMPEAQWELIHDILEDDEQARNDLQHFSKVLELWRLQPPNTRHGGLPAQPSTAEQPQTAAQRSVMQDTQDSDGRSFARSDELPDVKGRRVMRPSLTDLRPLRSIISWDSDDDEQDTKAAAANAARKRRAQGEKEIRAVNLSKPSSKRFI